VIGTFVRKEFCSLGISELGISSLGNFVAWKYLNLGI
jgi:hypothetical protein